jgi:hypothetical protein
MLLLAVENININININIHTRGIDNLRNNTKRRIDIRARRGETIKMM